MANKMSVVPINLFRLAQEILIVDDTNTETFAQVDLSELPEVIIEAANTFGIEDIKLMGNENYATALLNEIKEYSLQNYSNNNLNIIIMEV